MKNLRIVIGVGLLFAAGIAAAQTPSTIVTFSVNMATNLANGSFNPPPPAGTGTDVVGVGGSFNGYAVVPLVEEGTGTIWTNTVDDTADPNGGNLSYVYWDTQSGYEGPADWANRAEYLPTNSGATLVLPTCYFNDVGPATSAAVTFQVDMSEEIELGHWNPQSDTVVIAGSFQGWNDSAGAPWVLTNNPNILVTNYNFPAYPNGLVESNVYTATVTIANDARVSSATVNCAENYKFVEMPNGGWDSPLYPNADTGGNRFFTEGDQTLPIVNFNDSPYGPPCQTTVNIDMSGVIDGDTNYVPGSLQLWGSFNSWNGGVPMTNNPTAPNANLYSCVLSIGQNAQFITQARYTNSVVAENDPSAPWVYDFIQGQILNNNYRRTIEAPLGVYITNFPAYYFNDQAPNDILQSDTPVLFSVNMNDAVDTNGYEFEPGSDSVYINGVFAGGGGPSDSTYYPQAWYTWAGGPNPVSAPAGYQMIQEGSSGIYTNTIVIPRGTPVALSYQYGMDPSSINGGPLEDEAPAGANHFRVVRSTALNPYVMPVDTFTNPPYEEPFFSSGNIMGIGNNANGDLTVGSTSGGRVPVTWLGRPGAHLQSAASLNGPWTDIRVTDGTNWTSGVNTINGLMSVTNWPGNGKTFFRLVKP
jgi:hypothetical protein